jgi:hypothetical protein
VASTSKAQPRAVSSYRTLPSLPSSAGKVSKEHRDFAAIRDQNRNILVERSGFCRFPHANAFLPHTSNNINALGYGLLRIRQVSAAVTLP